MSSRREELEAKRQRLQELRRQREEKLREQKESQSTPIPNGDRKSSDIDSLVTQLVGNKSYSSPNSSAGSSAPMEAKKNVVYKSISIQTNESQPVVEPGKITYNKSTQTQFLNSEGEEDDGHIAKEAIEANDQDEKSVITGKVDGGGSDTLNKLPSDAQLETVDPVASIDETLLTSFFNRSFKIINRVMEEEDDILRTYTETQKDNQTESTEITEQISLKLDQSIYSIDASQFFPELLVISNGKNVFVYNSIFKKFEYHYKVSTDILNVQFSHLQSNIIFGTGYNGKLFSWNLESDSKLPYLVSSLSTSNHSYPVFALNQLSENNGTLISASTDGRICTWSTSMLSKPISPPIDLKSPKSSSLRFGELAPTSVINLPNDHGFLIVGCEDGNIYRVKRFDNKVVANPDTLYDKVYQKHRGPISALAHSDEFPTLFVSSSFDWTVLLWDVNVPERPILSIYRNNAISQVRWRNDHPTQIGFLYGNTFELLDLSIDPVIPILKLSQGKTLNKFAFDKTGSRVILGSVDGHIKIYDISLKEDASELGKFKRLYVK